MHVCQVRYHTSNRLLCMNAEGDGGGGGGGGGG